MTRVNSCIEFITSSSLVVNENITNTYINPSTTSPALMSVQRLFNGGGAFDI